jgi:glycosyltransferase involved in cell wall biosynthesis
MVSVIVPVYRSEDTLERCVSSLSAQTYEDIEIILVVDGPPDRSGVLAVKLAEGNDKIRVVFQENRGVSVSRNRGIKEAQGEYIRFVDSDDYVEADSIKCMVEAMEHNQTELVIAGYHHLYFGRTVNKLPPITGTFATKDVPDEVLCLYRTGFLNMPWNKLYRKEDIKEGFPTDLNLGEDLCFNLNYLKNTRHFTVIQETVCEYIQDDRGTTLSTKRRMDKIPIAFRLYETVKEILHEMYSDLQQRQSVLDSKLVVEFLDDLEGLYFDTELSVADKKEVIHTYERALMSLFRKSPNTTITLQLLDYRIIYFFLKRNMTNMTWFMIKMRGIVVKLLGRR